MFLHADNEVLNQIAQMYVFLCCGSFKVDSMHSQSTKKTCYSESILTIEIWGFRGIATFALDAPLNKEKMHGLSITSHYILSVFA